MGLDQVFSYHLKNHENQQPLVIELYFRKFNALQGYMERVFKIENIETISLNKRDLIKIKKITETILK